MTRILMRAPMDPFANPTKLEAMRDDTFSGNSGNLLFVHGITRALMTEDAEIDFDKCDVPCTGEDYERMNAEYDMFIIPLANAFRKTFIKYLDILTDMVRHLDMPCVVIGTGMQGNIDGEYTGETEEIRRHFKDFCDAVLEKSDSMGLRGEMTAKYLESLGYSREKNLRVIGCPSMYLYGSKLPEPGSFQPGPDMKISLNCKVVLPDKIHKYMAKVRLDVPDYYYVVQNHYEMKAMYTGLPLTVTRESLDPEKVHRSYPADVTSKVYKEDRIRGFINVKSWMRFLSKRDLSFGTRIHGNITAVLSGTPAFVVAPDARVLELAKYHNIPHTTLRELDMQTDIFKLIGDVDFSQVLLGHEDRFANYLDFLHSNHIDTIFDHEYETVPFDVRMKALKCTGPIVPITHASPKEHMTMAMEFQRQLDEKNKTIRKLRKKLRENTVEPESLLQKIKRKWKKNN